MDELVRRLGGHYWAAHHEAIMSDEDRKTLDDVCILCGAMAVPITSK